MISRKNSHWMLTLYRPQKQTGTNSYEMLTSFSLPLASDNNEGMTVKRRPVLICVHYSNKTPSSVCGSPPERANNGHFCIDPVLFKLLFGIDTALAESPVVLCGLPDGCLYFLPLRLPGSRPRALYSLEQPVIFVGASSIDESGPEHAQCLVAMGEQGRVLLIRTRKGQLEEEANAACFLDRCLPGSLICGCIVKNTLYYSVGSDFLKLDLSSGSYGKEGQNRKEEASWKTEALHQSPTSLNVCRIIAVAELKCNTAGKKMILHSFSDILHKWVLMGIKVLWVSLSRKQNWYNLDFLWYPLLIKSAAGNDFKFHSGGKWPNILCSTVAGGLYGKLICFFFSISSEIKDSGQIACFLCAQLCNTLVDKWGVSEKNPSTFHQLIIH